MKLSKMITMLEEKYDAYRKKYGKDPIVFRGIDGIYLGSKKVKLPNGLFAYEGPFMRIPKRVNTVLEIGE